MLCVKVLHLCGLENVKESKWTQFKGTWTTMYKLPTVKSSEDLQWLVVHGIIATNRHRAHFDSLAGMGCPFCGQFFFFFFFFFFFADCIKLLPLVEILGGWCQTSGDAFTLELYMDLNINVARERSIIYSIEQAKSTLCDTHTVNLYCSLNCS